MNFDTTPLSPSEAARQLGLKSVGTLAKWRCSGRGPVFVKVGGRIVYLPSDIAAFINAGRRASTSEPDTSIGNPAKEANTVRAARQPVSRACPAE